MSDTVLTPHEVAEKLGVDYETVLRYLRQHDLAGVKRGGRWYIRESAYDAFLTADVETETAVA